MLWFSGLAEGRRKPGSIFGECGWMKAWSRWHVVLAVGVGATHLPRMASSRNFIGILLYVTCVLSVFSGGSLVSKLCHASSHLWGCVCGLFSLLCPLEKEQAEWTQNNLVVPSGGLMIGWQGVCRQRSRGWNWKGRRGHHRARGHRKNWLCERVSVPANSPPICLSQVMGLI